MSTPATTWFLRTSSFRSFLALWLLSALASANDLGARAYEIFAEHCASCHSPSSNSLAGVTYRGDLDAILDFGALRDGFYLDLETPERSELYRLIAFGEMPHQTAIRAGAARRLTTEECKDVLDWIRAGAPDPQNSAPANVTASSPKGEQAFYASCTSCHPASRALGKNKSLEQWQTTVERMAAKPGANVRNEAAIAAFLAGHSANRAAETGGSVMSVEDWFESLSLHGTFSAAFLDSGQDQRLENPGFVAEAWVTAGWNPHDSPLSARVTACTTCHSSLETEGRSIELAEAVFRFDVDEAVHSKGTLQGAVEAGRFIVPFGAFAAKSNPSAYRTVTRPLLFNMGQLVDRDMLGSAVLPMPYSDEGFLLNGQAQIAEGTTASLDAYVVNGLQGTIDVDFFQSRSYTDNNGDPALGGRLTVGNSRVAVGASAMTGNMEANTGALQGRLGYRLLGGDVNFRVGKRLNVQAEYAMRENDQVNFLPGAGKGEVTVSGYVFEANYLLLEEQGVSLTGRYDTMRHDGTLAPPTSSLAPQFRTDRFTWGFDIALFGGSSLILNHEHWALPSGQGRVDVLGARWVVSF